MNEKRYCEMFSQLHTSVQAEDILMKEKFIKKPRIMFLPLTAAIILILAIGVAAAYNYRLQDAVLPIDNSEDTPIYEAAEQSESVLLADNSEDVPVYESAEQSEAEVSTEYSYSPPAALISYQGFSDSPEYQAMMEWTEFDREYDRDGKILSSVGNAATIWDEKYNNKGYNVYSQEMADKLDEIVDRYGLKLHTGSLIPADMNVLRKVFGDFTSATEWGGYYYSDGTFNFASVQDLNEYGSVNYEFHRSMKGIFDTVSLNIDDADQYEQWDYKTACGEQALLALGSSDALILINKEDCFIVIHVFPWLSAIDAEPVSLSQEVLEALTDSFDFSIL